MHLRQSEVEKKGQGACRSYSQHVISSGDVLEAYIRSDMVPSEIFEPNGDGRGIRVPFFVRAISGWDDNVPWALVTIMNECGEGSVYKTTNNVPEDTQILLLNISVRKVCTLHASDIIGGCVVDVSSKSVAHNCDPGNGNTFNCSEVVMAIRVAARDDFLGVS